MYDSQSNLPEYTSWPAIINFLSTNYKEFNKKTFLSR